MNPRRRLPLVAPLLLALAACSPGGDAEGDLPADTAAVEPAATAPVPPPIDAEPVADEEALPSQPEALALLIAVNENEIAAAEQAREKGVQGEVLEFADMMHSDHTANLEATRELTGAAADVADSPRISSLRAAGEAELDRLSTLEGDEYARAYIEAMVEAHQDALDMLDRELIPAAAQDEAVREHLTTTRDKIAAHLQQAQTLASSTPPQ